MSDARRAIEFLIEYNALEKVPREGFRMNGVASPEDVAAHSAGVAAAALVIADRIAEPVDRGRMLTMAILHDLGESRVGDTPMPTKTAEHDLVEDREANDIVAGLSPRYRELLEEYRARSTLESRIVKAADKLQMMAKIIAYQRDGDGDLEAFWLNPKNFNDAGLPAARELYEAIRELKP